MSTMSHRTLSTLAGAVLLGLASPAALGQACEESVTARQLAQEVSSGDVAFADLDEDGFNAARWNAGQAVPCLNEPLSSGQVASFHRLQALGFFMDRDHANAVMSFKSVLAVAPGYDLPLSLAPDNHPLRVDFEVASGLAAGGSTKLAEPEGGEVRIDGLVAEEAPMGRPYVFQYIDANGLVAQSAVVRPGMEMPAYPVGKQKGRSGSSSGGGGLGLNVPLALTAGGAALLSGGLYAAASSRSGQFWNVNTADADLSNLRSQTNTLQGLSLGAGILAVGAGAGAVVVGSF